MAIGEVHDILEALLADRGKVLWRFQLRLVDDEVQHYLLLVLAYEFALINRVDWIGDGVPIEYTLRSCVETLA